jgi:hypothetical protein
MELCVPGVQIPRVLVQGLGCRVECQGLGGHLDASSRGVEGRLKATAAGIQVSQTLNPKP